MSSTKRKSVALDLQRRVRPRRELSAELESESDNEAQQSEVDHDSSASGSEQSESEVSGSESESESESPDAAASISFGALAKAQATLSQDGNKKPRAEEKVDHDGWGDEEAKERMVGRKDHRDFNRSSKHAPTEISSKKAVSRRREVVEVKKREVRDPRFESLAGQVDESKVRKAYAFLDDYREDEMKELKAAMKTTKDEDAKEKLKRALSSMESRKKAQLKQKKEQEILEQHRKQEKELVRQGKKPFYLKTAEQKRRVLLDQFGSLKGRQLDHVIERRRRKQEGKEKKKMPFARRGVE
ncbi:related to rRNA biogenesis protein rrp36 [Phialocephala subalpina]|uniref:rRNA biogenesis protein RRP36 n=1 Tax=Phialocephala subalpina TaxID=576137 RepID=A0A1L7X1J8_9HELO|nr:related to rRNA biogenesis protein rrp36 [Phialocephala subalpina]